MPVMDLKRFLELFEQDKTLQTQLGVYDPEDFNDLIDFAAAQGYLFTKDELLNTLKEYPDGAMSQYMRLWTP